MKCLCFSDSHGTSAYMRRALKMHPDAEVVFFLGAVEGVPKVREGEIDRLRWVTARELKDYIFPDTYEACKALLG